MQGHAMKTFSAVPKIWGSMPPWGKLSYVKQILSVFAVVVVVTGLTSCDPLDDPTPGSGGGNVPAELVGAWEYGYMDFDFWENYEEGRWAGRNAGPMREAMIFYGNGEARYYRYLFAFNLYEELIDCTGPVKFHDDGTFTFSPRQGRKRFHDFRHSSNSKDRALTSSELQDPKIAGKRGYTYIGDSDPPALQIKVPSSAPYNWYKKY
jgi:hypothetical protein